MMREAFQQAAGFFLQVVEQVPGDRWDAPALGVWTVQELVDHTCRALTTIETYSATPAGRMEMERPVDYFMRALERTGGDEIADRGRAAGRDLGSDPVAIVRQTITRVLDGLERTLDEAILGVPVGGMRLIDYLPTRIFELTIHTLDIASATGLALEPPDAPMKITLQLLVDRAMGLGQGPALALATTGRRPLPEGFSLV